VAESISKKSLKNDRLGLEVKLERGGGGPGGQFVGNGKPEREKNLSAGGEKKGEVFWLFPRGKGLSANLKKKKTRGRHCNVGNTMNR